MKLTMLGTGNAVAVKIYNTCYVFSEGERHLLVDGGGGNGLLTQLDRAGFDWHDMRDIIVTHEHLDHLMGILWMVRMIGHGLSDGTYEGEARFYGHSEVIGLLRQLSSMLLPEKVTRHIDERIQLIEVKDGETRRIIGHEVTFFDIHSEKIRQFGYTLRLADGRKVSCCGDETYNDTEEAYCRGADWLFHEAFCLYARKDECHPYEKHHSTARDAGRIAEKLGVKKLLIYHTEDWNLASRRQAYTAEAAEEFRGEIFVPDDLETIEL